MLVSIQNIAKLVIYLVTFISHFGFMKKQPANRIAEIRKARKLTQQELADQLGVHWVTISKLERGIMQMTGGWADRLAKALGVSTTEIWEDYAYREITVDGIVEGNSITVVKSGGLVFNMLGTHLGDITSRWLLITDDSLSPFFGNGDLLQFTLAFSEMDDETYAVEVRNRIGIFGTESDPTPQLMIMEAHNDDGTKDLRFLNGRKLPNTKVSVAYYLSGYLPAWAVVEHKAELAK
jgi:transcriptional regulator with XRE-family HTH domain